ncbi:DNA-directed RNA polymerase II subunit RPB1 [Diplonema papillatum]|nr:DNA-directed RNA polymerase II subunit RPB1 [Diplonema papillatum]
MSSGLEGSPHHTSPTGHAMPLSAKLMARDPSRSPSYSDGYGSPARGGYTSPSSYLTASNQGYASPFGPWGSPGGGDAGQRATAIRLNLRLGRATEPLGLHCKPVGDRIVVTGVARASAAEAGGVQPCDVVVHMAGYEILSQSDMRRARVLALDSGATSFDIDVLRPAPIPPAQPLMPSQFSTQTTKLEKQLGILQVAFDMQALTREEFRTAVTRLKGYSPWPPEGGTGDLLYEPEDGGSELDPSAGQHNAKEASEPQAMDSIRADQPPEGNPNVALSDDIASADFGSLDPLASPGLVPGSPDQAPGSPSHVPGSPSHVPGSPSHVPGSPDLAPGSPSHAPGSPDLAPGSPSHAPGSPSHVPGSPDQAPGSPSHVTGSPDHVPGSPSHAPGSPGQAPGSPDHMPGSAPGLSYEEAAAQPKFSAEVLRSVDERFQQIDFDHDGRLSPEEVHEWLVNAGCEPDEADNYVRVAIAVTDKNDDGRINMGEFLEFERAVGAANESYADGNDSEQDNKTEPGNDFNML